MCLGTRPTFPRPCNYLPTEGRRGPTASLDPGWGLVATAERGNPGLTVRLG